MAEKKTFTGDVDVQAWSHQWRVDDTNGNVHTFPHADWDIEITFTEKAPRFQVGEKVYSEYSSAYTYTVLAQYKDTVVVVDENDDQFEYFEAAELVRVT